jgi:polysaccharide biosynthesis/export protein
MDRTLKYWLVGFLLSLWVISVFVPQQSRASGPSEKKPAQAAVATNSSDYIIGPEDVLYINVWREEAITKNVPVRLDGKISLPLVNDVQAEGLTPLQLKDELTKLFSGLIENPTISVTVLEVNSFKVYVNGEVKAPGVRLLRQKTSFLQLITLVGGFTEWANQKDILLIRKDKSGDKRLHLNYKKIISGDEPDITINQGDIIIVK